MTQHQRLLLHHEGDSDGAPVGCRNDSAASVPRDTRQRAMSNCIVCAVDRSNHAFTVSRVADSLSRALDLRVVLVHVIPSRQTVVVPVPAPLSPVLALEQFPPGEVAKAGEMEAESAASLLEQIADAELLFEPELRLDFGEPSARILAVADDVEAQLIVVGSRRRGSLATMFLGSVSHTVATGTACPVVIVPHGAQVPAPSALSSMSMR